MASGPGGSDSEARVAVAVVSWNTRELLGRCLRSLEADASTGIADVWVVDNASTDGSAEMVRERHPWVHLIALDENVGYGRAVNLVAARTSTPWLVASNADVALRSGALKILLQAGVMDAGAGVIAPRLVLPNGETQQSIWPFPTVVAAAVQNLGPRLVPHGLAERMALRGAWDADSSGRVPWAEGAFLLIRRSAWRAIGGFDPAQWLSAEDLDLGWRMREAGWATRYESEAIVDHEESAATGEVWGSELPLHWQRCAYAWMVRRRGRARTVLVGLMNFVGSGGRYVRALTRARFEVDDGLRALGRWTLVHRYAMAPRRVLDRFR